MNPLKDDSEQTIKLKDLKLKLDYALDLVYKQTAITAKRDKKIISLKKDIKLKDIAINTLKRDKLILESLNNSQENKISKQKTRIDKLIEKKLSLQQSVRNLSNDNFAQGIKIMKLIAEKKALQKNIGKPTDPMTVMRDEIVKNKPIVHNNTDILILEAIKRQTNVLISINNLKNVSKDIEQITCEHPYNRVHQVDEVVYCNKCGTTINK